MPLPIPTAQLWPPQPLPWDILDLLVPLQVNKPTLGIARHLMGLDCNYLNSDWLVLKPLCLLNVFNITLRNTPDER